MSALKPSLIPSDCSVAFFAPFFNRSGYGITARGLAGKWHRSGVRLRIVPLGEMEPGIDDYDMAFLKSLESTPLTSPLAAVFFHVPNPAWLSVVLPPDSLRIMFTTFDSSAQGNLPPAEWVQICNAMDQLWLSSEPEVAPWVKAGVEAAKIHIVTPFHSWIENSVLPPVSLAPTPSLPCFRFLCIGMFQPRRRWDTLLEAFLLEFKENPEVELYLKVNYPSWHPVPGKPQRDLQRLVRELRDRFASKARVTLDESMGTRRDICELMDSCDAYVSTDTCITAPIIESSIRGRSAIVPESCCSALAAGSYLTIAETPGFSCPMSEAMLEYQPHHRGATMPLLRVADVRKALREAFDRPEDVRRTPWKGWEAWLQTFSTPDSTHGFISAIINGLLGKGAGGEIHDPSPPGLAVRWEGPFFVCHSLAHVNRQLCFRLLASGQVNLSLTPYSFHQYDGADAPGARPLVEALYRALPGPAAVHVRHQWPPNFQPPREGAWVMVQPWEYGGIPQAWVAPMSQLVDEIWVHTTWVRDRYVESGVPEDKVVLVPLGVDAELFKPEGPALPLRTRKGFRFLFLGGTIPRKGIDLLLEAYTQAFRASDDVCLVIKGQAGEVYEGHDLWKVLAEREKDLEAPEIEYRVENLTEPDLAALYRSCDAFVMPYRGEGFGLPIAEAMASGLPVIVTARGAASDFVKDEWAYLIPSRIRRLPKVDAYEPSAVGFWVEEPDLGALISHLRQAFEAREEGRAKGLRGRQHVISHLSWTRSTELVLERIEQLSMRRPCRFTASDSPKPTREALLFQPDFRQATWVEVVASYLEAFQPGEPVALLLRLDMARGGLSQEEVQEQLLAVITRLGRDSFPDIALAESEEELEGMLQEYGRAQWIPEPRGSGEGLTGWAGLRFARARERLGEALRA